MNLLFTGDKQYPTLGDLTVQAHQREKQAYAPGTYKNLEIQWACYKNFCAFYKLQLLPAQEETLVLFIKFLELNMKSPKTVYNYLLGAKIMHIWHAQDVSAFNSLRVKHMLRAVVKMSNHVVKQAHPITPQILARIRATLDFNKVDDITFWAMCLVSFMLMLRKSNLVPDTSKGFDRKKQLTRGHLRFVDGAVWVTIVWSKTLQFHLKELKFPLLEIPGSDLCPVKALKLMVQRLPLARHQPCFTRSSGQPWTYSQYQNKLRQCLKRCGYNSALFSSHSMRRGAVPFVFKRAFPLSLFRSLVIGKLIFTRTIVKWKWKPELKLVHVLERNS